MSSLFMFSDFHIVILVKDNFVSKFYFNVKVDFILWINDKFNQQFFSTAQDAFFA
jgi:hypothetical protein